MKNPAWLKAVSYAIIPSLVLFHSDCASLQSRRIDEISSYEDIYVLTTDGKAYFLDAWVRDGNGGIRGKGKKFPSWDDVSHSESGVPFDGTIAADDIEDILVSPKSEGLPDWLPVVAIISMIACVGLLLYLATDSIVASPV